MDTQKSEESANQKSEESAKKGPGKRNGRNYECESCGDLCFYNHMPGKYNRSLKAQIWRNLMEQDGTKLPEKSRHKRPDWLHPKLFHRAIRKKTWTGSFECSCGEKFRTRKRSNGKTQQELDAYIHRYECATKLGQRVFECPHGYKWLSDQKFEDHICLAVNEKSWGVKPGKCFNDLWLFKAKVLNKKKTKLINGWREVARDMWYGWY